MKRHELEHVLRAAAEVVDDDLVVIGSQAVLGQHPDAPDSLLQSLEVDLFPRNHPERTDEIDGALGDGSRFHQTFDYYAHGVGPETSIAPAGWQERLVRIQIPPAQVNPRVVQAWFMEVHDLVLAKLAAGRPHDIAFAKEALRAGLVDREQVPVRVELLPERHLESTRARLARLLTDDQPT